jgi:hypothetical protein
MCSAVRGSARGQGVLDRQARFDASSVGVHPRVANTRYRTPNWGPEEPTAPGTLAALESLRRSA